MATAALKTELRKLQTLLAGKLAAKNPLLQRLKADPARILSEAGLRPDAWQADLLRKAPVRTLLLCSRQSGKSQTTSGLALQVALTEPGSLVLLLSPSLRQSGELFRKVLDLYRRLGRPVPSLRPKDSALRLELTNGSRIESLPGTEGTVRSFSAVRLLAIDEAARVPDGLYYSVRPMLAVSQGSLIALSSAWAKQGWFYESWIGKGDWHKVKVTAHQCPRLSPEFLREEEEALGPRWFSMEYLCEFTDAVDALFTEEDVRAALTNELQPLFGVGSV
jgi:Terminase large subunit, T4likevirus-type, N-terminal